MRCALGRYRSRRDQPDPRNRHPSTWRDHEVDCACRLRRGGFDAGAPFSTLSGRSPALRARIAWGSLGAHASVSRITTAMSGCRNCTRSLGVQPTPRSAGSPLRPTSYLVTVTRCRRPPLGQPDHRCGEVRLTVGVVRRHLSAHPWANRITAAALTTGIRYDRWQPQPAGVVVRSVPSSQDLLRESPTWDNGEPGSRMSRSQPNL
jgi:hypothetical protein